MKTNRTCIRSLLATLLTLCLLFSLTGCSDVLDLVQDITGIQIGQKEHAPPEPENELSDAVITPATTAAAQGYTPDFVLNTFGTAVTSSSNAIVYAQANPNSAVIGQIPMNQKLLVTTIAHYGATTMACIGTNAWVDLRSLLFEGCSQSGIVPCVVWGNGTNMRTGPGTEYPAKGSYDRHETISITKIFYSSNGEAWGKMTNGYWVCIEFIKLPEGLSVGFGNNANAYIP